MWLLLLLAAIPLALAQEAGTDAKLASVKGVVLNSLTGEPVGKVAVLMTKQGTEGIAPEQAFFGSGNRTVRPDYTAQTNGLGVFVFEGIEPGTYSVWGERMGFYVSSRNAESRRTLKLAAGDSVQSFRLSLTPQGVIAGRVLDSDGEPIQRASVMVRRLGPRKAGLEMWAPDNGAATNDLGEFRIANQKPGRYLVFASVDNPIAGSRQNPGNKEQQRIYSTTFFPGVTASANAIPVEVLAGAVRQGVDIRMTKSEAHFIRGKVVDGRGQPSTLETHLFLIEANAIPGAGTEAPVIMGAEGSFDIGPVPAGRYFLEAQTKTGYVLNPVEVSDRDLADVRLTIRPLLEMKAKVRWEGEVPSDAGELRTFLEAGSFLWNVDGSGKNEFRLERVLPVRYRIMVFKVDDKDYVKTVLYGGKSVEDWMIDGVDGGEIEFVMRRGTGTVAGTVETGGGDPAAEATVVLVPADAAKRGIESLYHHAQAGERGTFEIRGVAPGEYLLMAFDGIEEDAWFDPDFVARFGSEGVRVKLEEKGRESKKVTLIRGGDR